VIEGPGGSRGACREEQQIGLGLIGSPSAFVVCLSTKMWGLNVSNGIMEE
jgi:hypothetical protein